MYVKSVANSRHGLKAILVGFAIFVVLSLGLITVAPEYAHAVHNAGPGNTTIIGAEPGDADTKTLKNPLGPTTTLSLFFDKLLGTLLIIAYPIVVLAIIYTGFLFLKAQGKPEELVKARSALLWTLIGALLVLGAVAISRAIEGTVREIGNTTELPQHISSIYK